MQYIPVDNSTADTLISAHDGDMALLYLYIARTGQDDLAQAARALCRTMGEVTAAYEKLQLMGLLDSEPRPVSSQPENLRPAPKPEPQPVEIKHPEPEETLPEYRTEDIMRRTKEDSGFAAIVSEAQKVLGHVLSSNDLKRLFGIYDYLALPPEVILMLLNHCVSVSQGRRPSMRFIEREAYRWANREIMTLDQAEEYIRRSRERRDSMSRIKEVLEIHGRELTATEQKYISGWLEMGFGEDCIAIAYDRTVTNTGALKWGYMNKILLSWREKGIHTAAEVAEKDGRRRSTGAAPVVKAPEKPVDVDKLRKLMDIM
jgi:DnaD/phage-associated family protein